MSEDNQKLRSGCPPDYQIFWEKYFENTSPCKFFKDSILTLSFSNKHISFWYLRTNCILYGIKTRATKYMSRTTRFQILVVLRLPTFDSNFATLKGIKKDCSPRVGLLTGFPLLLQGGVGGGAATGQFLQESGERLNLHVLSLVSLHHQPHCGVHQSTGGGKEAG